MPTVVPKVRIENKNPLKYTCFSLKKKTFEHLWVAQNWQDTDINGAFTRTLGWDGMGCGGNSVCECLNTLSYQRSPSQHSVRVNAP